MTRPSIDARAAIASDAFLALEAFCHLRLLDAKNALTVDQLRANGDAVRALNALEYLVTVCGNTAELIRDGLFDKAYPDPKVRAAVAVERWETLRHLARQWREHPDYQVLFDVAGTAFARGGWLR